MAAGKTPGGRGRRRATRARRDRHRRAARARAGRADRLLLRARGGGRVQAPRGAPGRLGSDALAGQVGGPSSVVALGGGAVESERGAARARRAHAGLVRRRRGGRLGAGRRVGPAARSRSRGVLRSLRRRRPLYESLARAILPSRGAGRRRTRPRRGSRRCRARPASGWSGRRRRAAPTRPRSARGRSACSTPPARRSRRTCRPGSSALRTRPSSRGTDGCCHAARRRSGSRAPSRRRRSPRPSGCSSELAAAGARRDDCVLAFGGGVVGDLAGFCAATYQRGVPLVQAPTTLVAQVDSAYGGKTGVDLPAAKNYVGAYHQPIAVLADPPRWRRCPREELAAGFVEVLKTGADRRGPALGAGQAARRSRSRHARRADLRVRAHEDRGGGRRRAGRRRASGPQPGPHRGPRDRGRDRLLALPARRGGGTRACWRRCASPGPTICATRSRACSPRTACRSRSIRRWRSTGSSTPSVATRSGPARGSASSCSSGPASRAGASRWSRVGSAPPWRS